MLFVARRPGTRVVEVDLRSGEVMGQFACAADRHLVGHACFSADGRVLYTTESAIAEGRGKIVLRNADSYAAVDEWDSHGVGPHDLKLLPSGRELVVANGGILTRPYSGRQPLNLDTMQSSLT